MMITHRPHRPAVLAVTSGLLTIGLLAGCSPADPAPSASPVASPEPTAASATPSPSPTPSAPEIDPAAVAAARESLAASISSGNTAALASWATDPIRVVIAASSFSEDLSPDDAALQADYIVDLTATWDFALPEATIDQYRAGDYATYFPADVLVGRSSTGGVVAFTLTGDHASTMFMCIDEMLLL